MNLFPLDITPAHLTGLWRSGDHSCGERNYLVLLSAERQLTLFCVDESCAVEIACDHQIAAKTGTTDGYKDNWTIGYTKRRD